VHLQQVFAPIRLDDIARGGRQVVEPEDLFRPDLVHRQGRGQDAGAGVGDSQKLEQPLDTAVLAVTAVQGDKGHVDARLPEHHVDVAVDEQRPGVVATVAEGGHHGLSGPDRDVPFGRQTAHEHTDLALSDHPSRVPLPREGVKKLHLW